MGSMRVQKQAGQEEMHRLHFPAQARPFTPSLSSEAQLPAAAAVVLSLQ